MRVCFPRRLFASAALVGVAAARVAHAGELDYRPARGCPSRADVEARLGSGPRSDVRIDVRRLETGFRGEVVINHGERVLTRAVEARSCEGVLEALALVVALDHSEQVTANEPAPEQTRDEPPGAAAPPGSALPQKSESDLHVVAPTTKERGISVAVFGGALQATSFAQGEMLFGPSVFAEVAVPSGIGGISWLKPAARASFIRTTSTDWTKIAGVAPDFTVTGGALDLCALGFSSEELAFSTCARTELGSLAASAVDHDSSARSRQWLAMGAVGRARYVFTIRGPIRPTLELSGGVLAPLVRDRFHYEGRDTIVAAPWLWTAAIGGGVELR